MASPQRVPPPVPKTRRSMHRAMDNLRFIRQTMERATAFTAVPGWGGVGMGALALVAAALVAETRLTPAEWLGTWLGTAVLALTLGGWAMAVKARRAGTAGLLLLGPPVRPELRAAARSSARCSPGALVRAGLLEALPGTWLLLYGTGVVTGGAFSVRVVPLMGLCFMALGARRAVRPAGVGQRRSWPRASALLHIVFGLIIARRYGG